MKPKVIVVLPCHNQADIIQIHLPLLRSQTIAPDEVIIVDDHSDEELSFLRTEDTWVSVVQGGGRGRSSTRNTGIAKALSKGADIILFMDGDSIVEDDCFIERLLTYFEKPSTPALVFGTRIHTERPYDFNKWVDGETTAYQRYPNKPSDLITANMDNLMHGRDITYQDLREVARVTETFNELESFEEKVDHVLTGMVTWSCNFAMTRSAANVIAKLMFKEYSLEDMWFDEVAFRDQWGYEDIAFGLDALYAGVEVSIQDNSRVIHFMHGRSDDHFAHIQGKHLIMERYRSLLSSQSVPGYKKGVSVVGNTISIEGRAFSLTTFGSRKVKIYPKEISVGNYVYDRNLGDFVKKKKLKSIFS